MVSLLLVKRTQDNKEINRCQKESLTISLLKPITFDRKVKYLVEGKVRVNNRLYKFSSKENKICKRKLSILKNSF